MQLHASHQTSSPPYTFLTLWLFLFFHNPLGAFPNGSLIKNPLAMQETQDIQVRFLGWEDPLEEEMATHSSILAWKILWTGEPGRLQSVGCKEAHTIEAP